MLLLRKTTGYISVARTGNLRIFPELFSFWHGRMGMGQKKTEIPEKQPRIMKKHF